MSHSMQSTSALPLTSCNSSVIDGCRIGWISSVDDAGRPLVDFPGNPHGPTKAIYVALPRNRTWEEVRDDHCSVILVFDNGLASFPVIIGVIENTLDRILSVTSWQHPPENPYRLELDHSRLCLEAKEEILLRCGKGSILIRKDGKIVIKGTHLVSRSAGANKIKGASVEIN